ncbi:PucR family transcriptional regulator [Candidatus Blastococcus massiliensis]|uniref:PucR family transcriptional regulator n=1 Tax=Candidatus Blastococcus massiliensis TaxID=1470358 RepID=UPI0004B5B356|nr:PucR family transcriptional regulator [Candidatus Blastococcus massiliensis]
MPDQQPKAPARGSALCAAVEEPDGSSSTLRALAVDLLGSDLDGLIAEAVGRLLAHDVHPRHDVEELARDVGTLLDGLLRRLAVGPAAAERTARDASAVSRRRAGRDVPLAASLLAVHTVGAVGWQALVARAAVRPAEEMAACLHGSGAVWTATDELLRAAIRGHEEGLAALLEADHERRRALLDALLDGRPGEWARLGGSLAGLGLPERGPYVAVSAESVRRGAVLPAVEEFLSGHGVRSAWRTGADGVVGIVAIGEWRTVTSIRELLGTLATGRVGLSRSYDDAHQTSAAVARAAVARRCLPAGAVGVTAIDDDPVAALLASSVETSSEVSRLLLGGVMDLPDAEQQTLLSTLATWLATNGNSTETARLLFCHRNTVRNRLGRLEQLSGQSLEDPRSVARLFVAVEALRLLEPSVLGDAGCS